MESSKITPIRRRPSVRDAFGILREQREAQVEMAELVDVSIKQRKCAAIEAGTGTGKSFGYLIPVVSQGRKAIVSTFTLALQEQLIRHDIPFLQKAMREKFNINFTAAMLKGASNYLCRRRFEEVSNALPANVAEWGDATQGGDMTDAPAMDNETQQAIRIDLDDCARAKCPFYGTCHYQAAKEAAKGADVLVVNHKMFTMGLENPFLLDISGFDVAIIDEAHQFEDVSRESFGGRLSPASLSKFFKAVEKEFVDPQQPEDWEAVRDAFRKAWVGVIGPWLPISIPDEKLLIPVEVVRERSAMATEALADLSIWVRSRIQEEPAHQKIDRQLDNIRNFFSSIKVGDVIAVAERKVKPGAKIAAVSIETYPLYVGPRLQKSLYPILPIIYCSATISAGGKFDLFKKAMGLDDSAPTVEIGSPFDYPIQSLLYVPRDSRFDARNNNRDIHMAAFLNETENLLALSNGRAFVLFTNNRDMREAFERRQHHFPCRWQEPGSNKNTLITWFKETPNAVLYATASFWEGVSIEGESLSLVIINKIPFPPPSDPIYKAKGALMAGGREFFDLSVPSAVIKLKQGFGRLIRTQSDRGMVAILDSRLVGKGYGRTIIAALPPARFIDNLSDRALLARYLAPAASPTLEAIAIGGGPTPDNSATLAKAEERLMKAYPEVGF